MSVRVLRTSSLSSFYYITDPFDNARSCQIKGPVNIPQRRYSPPLTAKDMFRIRTQGNCMPRHLLRDPYKRALINMYALVMFCVVRQGYCTKSWTDTGHLVKRGN